MAERAMGIKKPVAAGVEAVKKECAKAVEKPVSAWRQKVRDARVVVAKPWQRYRVSIFQFYLIVAVVAYFTFDVAITRELQKFKPVWFGDVMHAMYALSWIGLAPQVYVISLPVSCSSW